MTDSLDRAAAQVRAARLRCPLANVTTLERARRLLYRIDVARNTGRMHAQAVADAVTVIADLEREHLEGAREMRLTQCELFPEGRD